MRRLYLAAIVILGGMGLLNTVGFFRASAGDAILTASQWSAAGGLAAAITAAILFFTWRRSRRSRAPRLLLGVAIFLLSGIALYLGLGALNPATP